MADFKKYPKLIAFTEAIKIYEGGKPARKNPGNLKCPAGNKSLWPIMAIGQQNNFCLFETEELGMDALRTKIYNICMGTSHTFSTEAKRLFNLDSSADLNIQQCMSIYAPSNDNNNPYKYASWICAKMQVPITTKMKELLDNFDRKVEEISQPLDIKMDIPKIQEQLNSLQKFLLWLLDKTTPKRG